MNYWETEERYDTPGKRADESRRERQQERDKYHAMEERVAELEAERGQLRDQNADLLGQLDAVVFAHNVMQSQRDRLREAIKAHRRDVWGDKPTDHQHDNRLYAALQEAGDE